MQSTVANYSKIYLALTSVSFLWGTSFAAAKICLVDLTPMNVAALRFSIASVIFLCLLFFLKNENTIHKQDIGKFIVLGFLSITSYFYIQVTGLKYTTTINSALIIATSPIFTMLFARLIGWEKLKPISILGIFIAFFGVSTIITNGSFVNLFRTTTLKGDVMLLSNAIVWAGFTLYGKSILQKYHPFVAMAYIHIFGTIMLLPFAFIPSVLTTIPIQQQLPHISIKTLGAALYLAILCSVYAYYVWYTGVEKIGAVKTSVFSYLNPLFAIVTGIFIMKEKVTLYTLLGGIMVILGVYITNSTKIQSQHNKEQ